MRKRDSFEYALAKVFKIFTRAKVDANHATDSVTRRSVIGLSVYTNYTHILWFSKKKNIVKSRKFWAVLMAMNTCL